jgi:sirohydrochlorin ferrochelatase
MKAVLLVSHGSQSKKTKDEVSALANQLKQKSGLAIFEYAFLEIESPSIPEGIDGCVKKGASEIVLLLNFLNAGKHVDQDIPRIVKEASQKFPKIKFRITIPVGQHSKINELFLDLIKS